MALSEYDQKKVDAFLKATAPHWCAFSRETCVSYLALKRDEGDLLLQAKIDLVIEKAGHILPPFETDTVRVGNFLLKNIYQSAEELIGDLMQGVFKTPQGQLSFPVSDRSYYVSFSELHYEAERLGRRNDEFFIGGIDRRGLFDQKCIDWELKASPSPFESLEELMHEYRVGSLRSDSINVGISTNCLVEIDEASSVLGEFASIRLVLGDGLLREDVTLGFRILCQGEVAERGIFKGADIQWSNMDGLQIGEKKFSVPKGATVYCVASYRGVAYHETFIVDETTSQNPNGVIYLSIDSGLAVLTDFLNNSGMKGRDARDLEVGISWLFWMYGFSPALLGCTKRTQDAPDLVAVSPSGNYLIFECTTGLLKAENKLSNLIKRVTSLRNELSHSGFKHLTVLPVMVTSLSLAEIEVDLEQAEKHEVLVLTRERLDGLIADINKCPDPVRLFNEFIGEVAQKAASRSGRKMPFSLSGWG